MLKTGVTHSAVEWRPALSEDAELWVFVTRRSADQLHFEPEDAQIARYKEESATMQAQRYLLWRDDTSLGRLRFSSHNNTARLDGLVLLPEAGGSVAAQVVGEALVRAAALEMRHLEASYPAAYIASAFLRLALRILRLSVCW